MSFVFDRFSSRSTARAPSHAGTSHSRRSRSVADGRGRPDRRASSVDTRFRHPEDNSIIAPHFGVDGLLGVSNSMAVLRAHGLNDDDLRTIISAHQPMAVAVRPAMPAKKVDLDLAYGKAYFFPDDEVESFSTRLLSIVPKTLHKVATDPDTKNALLALLGQAGFIAGSLMQLFNGLKPDQVSGLLQCVDILFGTLKVVSPSLGMVEKFMPIFQYGVHVLSGSKSVKPDEAIRLMMTYAPGGPPALGAPSVAVPVRSIASGSRVETIPLSRTLSQGGGPPAPSRTHTNRLKSVAPSRPPSAFTRSMGTPGAPSVGRSHSVGSRQTRRRAYSVAAESAAAPSAVGSRAVGVEDIDVFPGDSISVYQNDENVGRRRNQRREARAAARENAEGGMIQEEDGGASAAPASEHRGGRRRRRRHSASGGAPSTATTVKTAKTEKSGIRSFFRKHFTGRSSMDTNTDVSRRSGRR